MIGFRGGTQKKYAPRSFKILKNLDVVRINPPDLRFIFRKKQFKRKGLMSVEMGKTESGEPTMWLQWEAYDTFSDERVIMYLSAKSLLIIYHGGNSGVEAEYFIK